MKEKRRKTCVGKYAFIVSSNRSKCYSFIFSSSHLTHSMCFPNANIHSFRASKRFPLDSSTIHFTVYSMHNRHTMPAPNDSSGTQSTASTFSASLYNSSTSFLSYDFQCLTNNSNFKMENLHRIDCQCTY